MSRLWSGFCGPHPPSPFSGRVGNAVKINVRDYNPLSIKYTLLSIMPIFFLLYYIAVCVVRPNNKYIWLHLLLLMPFTRIHCAQIKTTNQSQQECLTEDQSLLVHTLWAAPFPVHAITLSSSVSSVSGCNGGQTTTKQPNKKTAHPSFANNNLDEKDK